MFKVNQYWPYIEKKFYCIDFALPYFRILVGDSSKDWEILISLI